MARAHVRMHPTFVTNANPLADESFRVYQISAQSAMWLSRYSKEILGVVHVTRAHVRMHPILAGANPLVDGSLYTYQI